MNTSSNFSIFYMIISVVSIALSGFFAKESMLSVSIYAATFIRFFIPLTLLVFIFFIFKRYKSFNFKNIKNHLVRSIALTASQFCLFFSMTGLPMSEATVLYNTGPIFIVLFSIFLGSEIKLINLASMLLGTLGVLLITHIQNGIMNRYVFFGLVSGLAFCISQMALQQSSKKEDNLITMFFLYGLTSLFSAIVFLIFYKPHIYPHSINIATYLFLFLLGLSSFLNQFFRGRAYKESSSPASLAPLLYLAVFISALLDFSFFHVFPDREIIFGGVLILAGSYIAAAKKLPKYFYFKIAGDNNV